MTHHRSRLDDYAPELADPGEGDMFGAIADAAEKATARPPRGGRSPAVATAAAHIHPHVWREPYRPGEGPMHHAGGPYWRNELLRQADRWERLAKGARICAEVLPDA